MYQPTMRDIIFSHFKGGINHKIQLLTLVIAKYTLTARGQMRIFHLHGVARGTNLSGSRQGVLQDKKFNRMGQIVAKARGDGCVQCLHENVLHTIKKKQQPRVRHSLTVPRLHSHFREHLAG